MAEEGKTMKGYKAFNKDMTCRNKQYAENTVYEEPEAELCSVGMHFCENPFDVLKSYSLVSENGELITTAEVEPFGEVKTDGVKSVTTKLRVGAKLSFPAFVRAGVDFLIDRTKTVVNGTNDNGIDGAQIGSAGYAAQIGSSGYAARIGSSGDDVQIGSSGDAAQIGSSGYAAQIGSAGYDVQIGSSGYAAQIGSSGYAARIGSVGKNSVICCAGHGCVASAKKGSWITLSEWGWRGGEYAPLCVKTEFVDGERIKECTPYRLENGEFVEVKEDE